MSRLVGPQTTESQRTRGRLASSGGRVLERGSFRVPPAVLAGNGQDYLTLVAFITFTTGARIRPGIPGGESGERSGEHDGGPGQIAIDVSIVAQDFIRRKRSLGAECPRHEKEGRWGPSFGLAGLDVTARCEALAWRAPAQ